MFRRILSHRGVLAAIATVLVLLLLASWHYWTIVSSLSDARAQLLDVEEHLSDIGLDLTSEELAHTQAPLAAAGRDLGRARTHLRLDPLLHLGRLLPGPGEQIEALDRVLRMGEILLAIGEQATAAAGKAVALRENPPEGTQLAVALTGLLADIEPEMDRIDALLDELVATRFELGDGPLLPPLDATRSRIDADLPALANSLESLSRLRAFAPRFLGFEGERRYLVLALNEGQLMPGGGFVTATGVLTLRDGTPEPLSLRDAGTWRTLWLARGGSYIEPPGPLRRYLLKSYTWNLTVINWSPHFPTWAAQALELHELLEEGRPLDGVIALNLQALVESIRLTGPKTLDIPGEGPVTFTAENAVLELERVTRAAVNEGADRKSILGELATVLFDDLRTLPPEQWVDAIETFRRLGEGRYIQALAFDPHEQTVLRDVRWDGRIESPAGDYLQFNEANVSPTKLNLVIKPEGTWSVDLDELGNAHHELTLAYWNTLPEWRIGKDQDLVDMLMLADGHYGGYLRVFAPPGAIAVTAEIDRAATAIADRGNEQGKDWFGVFLPLPAGIQRAVTLRWTVPLATTSANASSYDLYLQKQPGAATLCLAFHVTRAGQAPTTFAIDGGRIDEQGRLCLETDARLRASW